MVKRYRIVLIFAFVIAGACTLPAVAEENPSTPDEALVTLLEGTAKAFTGEKAAGLSLKKGSKLKRDQEVKVAKKSRIEIRFPDGTVMRFGEKSTVKLNEVYYDKKSGGKSVKVNLSIGKIWANVKKLVTADSKVEVRTTNAVAGVRGTVYRVNVEEDASAMVKVYDGSVDVAGVPREVSKPAQVSGPAPVPGPHEVSPPYHEVSMEEWHVIVKSFQQVTISPQGVASEPKDFTPQEDMDDWVKWNQERDKQVSF